MSSIIIFKSNFVNSLLASLDSHLDKYNSENPWILDAFAQADRDIRQTALVPTESICLDPELKDVDNAIRFHKALRHLTPLQARDPRLWTRLAHVDFWSYMRHRWPIEKHASNKGRAKRFVEAHYFVTQSQSRSLIRNGIARLWWTAQLSYDSDRENPYELTEVLLSALDITQQFLERGMGRASDVIKGVLTFLLANEQVLLTGGNKNRLRIRRLAKFLNMTGGVCILDTLTQSEVRDLLDEELARIITDESSAEAKAQTQ